MGFVIVVVAVFVLKNKFPYIHLESPKKITEK